MLALQIRSSGTGKQNRNDQVEEAMAVLKMQFLFFLFPHPTVQLNLLNFDDSIYCRVMIQYQMVTQFQINLGSKEPQTDRHRN